MHTTEEELRKVEAVAASDLNDEALTPRERALLRLQSNREALESRLFRTSGRQMPLFGRSSLLMGEGGLLDKLPPIAQAALSLARRWWERQPARAALQVAQVHAEDQLSPLIRKHPFAAVIGAAVAGATFVLVSPKGALSNELVRGRRWLGRQLRSETMKALFAAALVGGAAKQAQAQAATEP